jgi:hypothetical protein
MWEKTKITKSEIKENYTLLIWGVGWEDKKSLKYGKTLNWETLIQNSPVFGNMAFQDNVLTEEVTK